MPTRLDPALDRVGKLANRVRPSESAAAGDLPTLPAAGLAFARRAGASFTAHFSPSTGAASHETRIPHRRCARWRRTRRVLELAGAFFTIVLIIFVINVIRNPDLPDILRADTHGTLHAIRGRLKPKSIRPGRKHKVSQLGKIPQNYDPLRAAFYVSWDSNSLASLQSHYHDLDLLIPEALHAV